MIQKPKLLNAQWQLTAQKRVASSVGKVGALLLQRAPGASGAHICGFRRLAKTNRVRAAGASSRRGLWGFGGLNKVYDYEALRAPGLFL